MRLVFDSNIYVSAFAIAGGRAEKAILKAVETGCVIIISKEIIHEVLGVLSAKFSRDSEALSRTAVHLAEIATVVTPSIKIKALKDEPDNRILECALAGRADAVVTGDKEMIKLGEFEGIRIITLKKYLES